MARITRVYGLPIVGIEHSNSDPVDGQFAFQIFLRQASTRADGEFDWTTNIPDPADHPCICTITGEDRDNGISKVEILAHADVLDAFDTWLDGKTDAQRVNSARILKRTGNNDVPISRSIRGGID